MKVLYPDTRAITAFGLIVLFDLIWFSASLNYIYPKFKNIKPFYGILAWLCLAICISLSRPVNTQEAAIYGLVSGSLMYGVFNGTESAIREDWRSLKVIIADISWGSILCMMVSIITHIIEDYSPYVTIVFGIVDIIIITGLSLRHMLN